MEAKTYSIQQTAGLLGVSNKTVLRKVDAGEIPTIVMGRRRLIPRLFVQKLFAATGYPLEETGGDTNVSGC